MPNWSPDGSRIVYQALERDKVFIANANGSDGPTQFSPSDQQCGQPRWSPDGTQIAFICGLDSIYAMNTDQTELIRLVDGGIKLQWSPDGNQIAFVGDENLDSALVQPMDLEGSIHSNALFLMDANGANIKRLTPNNDEEVMWFAWLRPTAQALWP
jgi:dipeptidyl aminopeptidase/acylaminoacyl peptidase